MLNFYLNKAQLPYKASFQDRHGGIVPRSCVKPMMRIELFQEVRQRCVAEEVGPFCHWNSYS